MTHMGIIIHGLRDATTTVIAKTDKPIYNIYKTNNVEFKIKKKTIKLLFIKLNRILLHCSKKIKKKKKI